MKYLKKYEVFERENLDKRLPSDRVVSAQDLLQTEFDEGLDLEGKYKILFGNPSPSFSMMLFGPPASGKTYFAIEFAHYLTRFGKVLYISSEEFGSVTLVDKLKDIIKKNDIKKSTIASNDLDQEDPKISDNLYFAKGMTDLEGYDYIFIDSVNDLDLDLMDYKEVRDIYPDTAFVSILQATKAEDFRGGKDWEHEMDIAVKIEKGIAETYKNRFDVYGSYDTFNDKEVEKREDDKTDLEWIDK